MLPENAKTLNYNVFEEKVTFEQVEDAVSIFPAFSERRVVVVKESNLFKTGEKQQRYDDFLSLSRLHMFNIHSESAR